MGTRGMLAFAVDGREIITYNHYDSYPDGLGMEVLKWLRTALEDPAALRASVAGLKAVSEDHGPTEAEISELREHMWTKDEHGGDSDLRSGQEWYDLLHECMGDPAMILKSGYAVHAPHWPEDSLFCEYGYLIDLDGDGAFEAYKGFQRAPHNLGRFAGRITEFSEHDKKMQAAGVGPYYEIALVASWPLAALPSDEEFMAAFGSGDDEEE